MHACPKAMNDFQQNGFLIVTDVFDLQEIESLAIRLSSALEQDDPVVLRSRGRTYGSRNLLRIFPEVIELVRRRVLREFSTAILGAGAGIVRALYFDKPPDRSWSLPWHKDRTIAVQRNDLPSRQFQKPTFKAGIAHVEAPNALLENMLTLRVHLDAMSGSNGPLSVIPGSHHENAHQCQSPVELHAKVGDVLAMRPLLSHSSAMSSPDNTFHRRVIHIELAGSSELEDGYRWHSSIPVA
jgi:hypothetical protein